MVLGDNGIINKSQTAVDTYRTKVAEENAQYTEWEEYLDTHGLGVGPGTDPVVVEGITVTREGEGNLEIDDTVQLTAEITPNDATNKSVTWSTDDEEVATVSSSGQVTAVGAGTVTITATANDNSGVTGTVTVTVDIIELNIVETNINLVKINNTEEIVGKNGKKLADKQEQKLNIENQYMTLSYTWSSSNENVATVDNTGTVTPISAGNATIICSVTTKGGNVLTDTCNVTVTQKLYLYYYGNEFTSITGGWKQGARNSGTFSKNTDNIQFYYSGGSGDMLWNAYETTNAINVTNYGKLKYNIRYSNYMTIKNERWTWFGVMGYNPRKTKYTRVSDSGYYPRTADGTNLGCRTLANTDTTSPHEYLTDFSKVTGNLYITMFFDRWYSTSFTFNAYVYDMWLEK